MIRSTSSPVPTGTVDLSTITVKPDRTSDFLARRIDIAQIRMAIAAPRRRADRDEHRVGIPDGPRPDRW
jgi:hypothetical protein